MICCLKVNWRLVAGLLVLLGGIVFAQEDWQSFKKRSAARYQSTTTNQTKNMVFLVSSEGYKRFISDTADSSFAFPVKFIWTSDGNRHYILQPLPDNLGEEQRNSVIGRASDLKNMMEDVLPDLQKYAFSNPLEDIPDNAGVNFNGDTVMVSYKLPGMPPEFQILETYFQDGKLGRVVWQLGEQKVVTFPVYAETNGKFICMGWHTQKYAGKNIVEGYVYELTQLKDGEQYLPVELNILAQAQPGTTTGSAESDIKTGVYRLYFNAHTFNEPIEVRPATSERP